MEVRSEFDKDLAALWMPADQQGLRIRIPTFKSAGFPRRSPSTHSIQFNPAGLVLSFQPS
jgi:hypothetical protein